MKRSELVKGETYVVAAPSVTLDGRYAGTVKKVVVLDTEPNFVEQYLGWSSRETLPKTTLEVPEVGVLRIPDQTRAPGYDAEEKDAKRLVRVLVLKDTRYGRYDEDVNHIDPDRLIIKVVPISQVRMTWANYEAMRAGVAAAAKREDRRRRDRERVEQAVKDGRAGLAAKLNRVLGPEGATGIQAKVILDQVVLTGAPADLLDAARLVANA